MWSYLNGHVKMAKIIAFVYPNVVLNINQSTLDIVCAKGHFGIAQWFLKLNPKILLQDEYRFGMDCFNGKLSLSPWLVIQNVENMNV